MLNNLVVSPERISFAHPCRPVNHLKYAKEQMVVNGTVDNEYEVYKLYKHYPNSNLIADAAALLLLPKALDLKVTGTSFHVGSGCSEVEAYDRAIEKAENIFKCGELIGHDMNLMDIGGGFPGTDDALFENIADAVNTSVQLRFPDERVQIIAEPGRFFVEAAYTLIFVTPEVFLGCDAQDRILEEQHLPNLNRGDLVVFRNMGAYAKTMAKPFNGFEVPRVELLCKSSYLLLGSSGLELSGVELSGLDGGVAAAEHRV
ncbi:hypothetical protein M5D96_010332 [Drosophila gunungcola]|uniref:Orn/DAP/Arg decarboxylase 2 N-terminal domain-containing protein n=1 Tax=Drosophila gunungcola TaxID=103775 RepID=A0A9P9YHE0_9MUSC|nr:hypothetical protein M5D96_010332 [Drosophila gunungcola]